MPNRGAPPSLEERDDLDPLDDCDDFLCVPEQEPVGLRPRRLDLAAITPAADDDIPF